MSPLFSPSQRSTTTEDRFSVSVKMVSLNHFELNYALLEDPSIAPAQEALKVPVTTLHSSSSPEALLPSLSEPFADVRTSPILTSVPWPFQADPWMQPSTEPPRNPGIEHIMRLPDLSVPIPAIPATYAPELAASTPGRRKASAKERIRTKPANGVKREKTFACRE